MFLKVIVLELVSGTHSFLWLNNVSFCGYIDICIYIYIDRCRCYIHMIYTYTHIYTYIHTHTTFYSLVGEHLGCSHHLTIVTMLL